MAPNDDAIAFEIVYDASEGTVVTARVAVAGGTIELMGEVVEDGRRLVVTGVHVAVRGPVRMLTRTRMAAIARRVMQEMDYDEIIVEGAVRTTGARPGRRPRSLRFR